jgi:hypothetical protein
MLLPTLLFALAAPVRLGLAFTPDSALPPAVVRAASAEAADIWAPHGVAVDLLLPCGWVPDNLEVLTIAIAGSSTGSGPWQGRLGTIAFDAEDVPRPYLTVFFDGLMRMIASTPMWMAGAPQWPPARREQVVGRALGRVIAHEIGHFVLRTRDHTSSGLMRPVLGADELVATDRGRFALWRPATATRTVSR